MAAVYIEISHPGPAVTISDSHITIIGSDVPSDKKKKFKTPASMRYLGIGEDPWNRG